MPLFVRALMEGRLDLCEEQLREIASGADRDLLADSYVCIIAGYGDEISSGEAYQRYCVELPRYCTHYFAKHRLKARIVPDGAGKCEILLMNPAKGHRFERQMNDFGAALRRHRFEDAVVAVGVMVQCLSGVAESWLAAHLALQYRNPNEIVLYSKNVQMLYSTSTLQRTTDVDKVLSCFRTGDLQQLRALVSENTERVRAMSHVRSGAPYPTSIKRMFVELTVYVLHIASDAGVNVDALLDNTDPYAHLMSLPSTPQIIDWFMEICRRMQDAIGEIAKNKESGAVAEAQAYILQHLSEYDLSLEKVSAQVGITPTYLSTLFGKEKGVGFSSFISSARIEAACELLKHTELSVAEIANRVGFSSVSYFSRVFKRTTGMTPGQARHGS